MSEQEAEVLRDREPVEYVEEDEGDRVFFESIRVPSVNKETIINLSIVRVKEIRRQLNRTNSAVSDLRQSNAELRSTITELRQSIEQVTQQSTETINMNTSSQINNHPTSSPVFLNHQPITTPNVEKPNIKATQPEPFSGEKTRIVNDWLAAVKRYMVLSGVEENKWVAYAVTMFTSTALSWWNSIELSNSEKSILDYSWAEFVDLVRERFVPVDSKAVAMSKMSQWKQVSSVAAYICQFQSFDQLIPKEHLDEEMRVQMFIQGLKPECRTIINMWEPRTLQQVYKMAQKFDNGQRQSHPKFNPHPAIRINRTRSLDQQEGTQHNPITFNNTEMQAEDQSAASEQGEDDLYLMNGQRGVCYYCKSPDHYMNVCPKLKAKRQLESHPRPTMEKENRSVSYSKNRYARVQ